MRRRLIAAAAALVDGLASIGPAVADTSQVAVVSADPVDNTPHVLDGTVRAIAVVGGTAIVGGDFYRVRDASRQTTYRRANIFAYEIATGRILGFAPELDGAVYALAAGSGGTVPVPGPARRRRHQWHPGAAGRLVDRRLQRRLPGGLRHVPARGYSHITPRMRATVMDALREMWGTSLRSRGRSRLDRQP